MKIRKMTITAAFVVMGGLSLAGCQSNSGNGASGSGATTKASSTSGASGAAVNVNTNVNAQSTNTSSTATASSGATDSQSGGGSSDSGSNYGICQASGLKISLDGQNGVSSQIVEWVQLTNVTSTSCTMDGFAGVNLVGSASGQSNYTWPLTRDSEGYSEITVKPGESAYFGIKYLPWASGDGAEINVANIVLTPPNTTTSITLPWSASVELQDAATAPGTYLTPVALGNNG